MTVLITTAKAALLLMALLCACFQWIGLRNYLSYQSYHRLAEAAGEGRLETEDTVWVKRALEDPVMPGNFASPQLLRSKAMIHLYNVDLIAASKGLSPFLMFQDSALSIARLEAMTQLKATLTRIPSDGDLWLRLALLERAEVTADTKEKHYLRMSRKTTPHEDWITKRRPATPP